MGIHCMDIMKLRSALKISVIIPTYNRARFVGASIESVLSQKYEHLELIIVDDGSTDNTKEVLAFYENRIRVIHQENRGVSQALNRGLAETKGEWIGFLDSDDEWLPGYLEHQMGRIDLYPKIIAHVMNAYTIQLDKTKEDLFQANHLGDRFGSKEHLILDRPLATVINHRPWFRQSILFRRDALLSTGGFDPALSIAEDLDVIARIALQGPFSICKRALVHVIRREEEIENLVSRAKKRRFYTYRSFGKVFDHLLDSSGLTLSEKIAVRRAQGQNWRAMGNALVLAGRNKEARKYYRKSFFFYPSVRSFVKMLVNLVSSRVSVRLVKDAGGVFPGDDEEA